MEIHIFNNVYYFLSINIKFMGSVESILSCVDVILTMNQT